MIPEHRQDGHAPCPMAGHGAFVPRPTMPADACPPACTELYRRLCERLAVPSRTPPRDSPEGCETGAELLKTQAQWLKRAIAHERERGRARELARLRVVAVDVERLGLARVLLGEAEPRPANRRGSRRDVAAPPGDAAGGRVTRVM